MRLRGDRATRSYDIDAPGTAQDRTLTGRSRIEHPARSRLIGWAETLGPATGALVRTMLESKPHPEMGYRACLGIMSLAKTYTPARVEAASQRALLLGACSYQSLNSILKHS